MIWPFRKTHTALDQAEKVLDPFVSSSLLEVGQFLEQPIRTRRLVECYIYGAIRYLASYDDMPSGSSFQLMQLQLDRHFGADTAQIEQSLASIKGVNGDGEAQLFMIEGASALRRWLVCGDQSSGKNLQELLANRSLNA